MRNVIREDEGAVSPVIATILMVAITVVLAAVLYVMVSGLISGPGSTPQAMGVSVSTSGDGTNWVLLVSSTPTGKAYTATTLAIFKADGSSNLSARALGSLSASPATGCSLSQVSPTATAVQVGDRILCKTGWYLTGSTYQISDGTTLLASGKLT
jgi:flagellin-like protein